MQLALVGLSHKTAPVEIRERLAFSGDGVRTALTALTGRQEVNEAIILSTCNRVEVVAQSADNDTIREFLCEFHQIPHDSVSKHLYSFRNADAIRHVFRVTSSLDSMVVGEPQILGQVKEAFRIATDAGTVGMHLTALMNRAFAVAKKIRTETGISQSAVSVSYAAVELARKIFGDLSGKTVMIIGASKMGELAAKHLRRGGASSVLVTNRTFEGDYGFEANGAWHDDTNFPEETVLYFTNYGPIRFVDDNDNTVAVLDYKMLREVAAAGKKGAARAA